MNEFDLLLSHRQHGEHQICFERHEGIYSKIAALARMSLVWVRMLRPTGKKSSCSGFATGMMRPGIEKSLIHQEPLRTDFPSLR